MRKPLSMLLTPCLAALMLFGCVNGFVAPQHGGSFAKRMDHCENVIFGSIKPWRQQTRPQGTSTVHFAGGLTEGAARAASDVVASSGSGGGMNPLLAYFLETVISSGVPALFTILVIGFSVVMIGKSRKREMDDEFLKTDNPAAALYDDLYGDQQQDDKLPPFLRSSSTQKLPKNSGIPKDQYLTVTHLNQKLDSYAFSVEAATKSKAAAAASFRKTSFARAMEKALGPMIDEMPPSTMQALQKAEAKFLKEGREIVSELQRMQTKLTAKVIDGELRKMGMDDVYDMDPVALPAISDATGNETVAVKANETAANTTSTAAEAPEEKKKKSSPMSGMSMSGKGSDLVMELQDLELKFVREVVKAVGPESGPSLRAALLGDVAARGSGGLLLMALEERPLTALAAAANADATQKPRLFMTRFPGDTTASQVSNLREEVTAIVRSAKPGDEALVVLQTGGGTVTGYGLAASQLLRFKEAGLKLTIAVEQVAASGGYMMCCVADKIIASPFAVLGSIGVISDIPNVYERLRKEGVEFQTVTAGKYKRTLTPTKKVTQADFDKTKEDVEEILVLFRDFVAQNRPQLDIEKVATGETWFGTAALERNLCDEIKSVDGALMEFVDTGYDVYEVKYSPPPPKVAFRGLVGASSSGDDSTGGWLRQGIRWVVRTIASEVREAVSETDLSSQRPIEERYRMEDNTAQRIKSQD